MGVAVGVAVADLRSKGNVEEFQRGPAGFRRAGKKTQPMPQLDQVSFFSQFFWLCVFFFGFYFAICKVLIVDHSWNASKLQQASLLAKSLVGGL